MTRLPRAWLPLAAALALLLVTASSAAATDDYTLPFYDPDVPLSHGFDRDWRQNIQLDWTGKVWYDGEPHWGRSYDNHTGLDYPMALFSTIAAAKKGDVVDVEGGYGTTEFGPFGNFVQVRHNDGRHTLYYHLASRADGGIIASVGENVPPGEPVGRSGCSGICSGPHLHLEVLKEIGQDLVPTDPMYHRLWTTWPGRVPFLASYVRESNAGTEVIRRWRTITHWVEFRNQGGRTWKSDVSRGGIALATWDPSGHDSPFAAADWPKPWLATEVNQDAVAPGAIGRFTFGLRGSPPPGSYAETFNLMAQGVRWFDHAHLGGFYIPIVVTELEE
jgi:murein DD-endopeptidase MepM/ murein hydrolase activator NlpD